jgi:carbon-monoxide dehydrogenase medium subunit
MEEAADCLRRYGGEAAVVAGGTDLLPGIRSGKKRPGYLISLSEARDAGGLEKSDGYLAIGPRATMADVFHDPSVKTFFPALAEAARVMGSQQIRNKATVIGNVCNASPAAETAAPLLVHEAAVSLFGPAGVREISIEDFFRGPGHTAKKADELVTAIKLPIPGLRERSVYRRISRREGVDLAIVNVAILKSRNVESRNAEIKLAYGSLAPVPFRPREAEAAAGLWLGKNISEEEFSRLIEHGLSPIDDLRSSAEYKVEMAKNLTIKGLHDLENREESGSEG